MALSVGYGCFWSYVTPRNPCEFFTTLIDVSDSIELNRVRVARETALPRSWSQGDHAQPYVLCHLGPRQLRVFGRYFTELKEFHFLPIWGDRRWEFVPLEWSSSFVECFFCIDWYYHVIFLFRLLILWVTWIDFWILNQPRLRGMNSMVYNALKMLPNFIC